MTKERAIICLRRYNRHALHSLRMMNHIWIGPIFDLDVHFKRVVYRHVLAEELIRRIEKSTDTPLQVVRDLYYSMDYILGESDDDHFETHEFASTMCLLLSGIIRYMKWEENETYEKMDDQLAAAFECQSI